MRMPTLIFGLFFCPCLTGCKPAPPAPAATATVVAPAVAAAPPITGLPATMTVKQRTQTVIPGSGDAAILSIGDITRGKVEASIRSEKEVYLQPVYLSQGDRRSFEFQKRSYELTLTELNNALVGEDFATFTLREAGQAEVLSESQKIDRLIARVESLDGAVFIRNGDEHSPQDAAKHLRDKREAAGEKLKTAEEFIDQIGSRSSLSGKDYEIRFSDGRVVKAGEYLKDELKKLTAAR